MFRMSAQLCWHLQDVNTIQRFSEIYSLVESHSISSPLQYKFTTKSITREVCSCKDTSLPIKATHCSCVWKGIFTDWHGIRLLRPSGLASSESNHRLSPACVFNYNKL